MIQVAHILVLNLIGGYIALFFFLKVCQFVYLRNVYFPVYKEKLKIAHLERDIGRDLLGDINRNLYITIGKIQEYLLLRYLEL